MPCGKTVPGSGNLGFLLKLGIWGLNSGFGKLVHLPGAQVNFEFRSIEALDGEVFTP